MASQYVDLPISGPATPVSVANGGTGDSTLTAHAVLIGNGTNPITFVLPGTNGNVLTSNGTDWVSGSGGGSGTVTSVAMTVPAFLSISGSPVTTSGTLAVSLSGTALPVANGGTGDTTLTAHSVLIGNGTSAIGFVAPGATGRVLTSNGTDWVSSAPATSGTVTSVGVSTDTTTSSIFTNTANAITGSPITTSGTMTLTLLPQSEGTFLAGPVPTGSMPLVPTFRALSSVDIPVINLSSSTNGGVSNNLPITNLDSGTGATNTTYWRGDGTWAIPPGGSAMPAGSTLQYQYNNSGSFAANSLLQISSDFARLLVGSIIDNNNSLVQIGGRVRISDGICDAINLVSIDSSNRRLMDSAAAIQLSWDASGITIPSLPSADYVKSSMSGLLSGGTFSTVTLSSFNNDLTLGSFPNSPGFITAAVPAGSTGDVQYNNAGALGGITGATATITDNPITSLTVVKGVITFIDYTLPNTLAIVDKPITNLTVNKGIVTNATAVTPVANGTYTTGIGPIQNGAITITSGIITAIQEAM